MTERILKSSISILDAFNDVRNNKSLAHDNPVLNRNESLLIFPARHQCHAVRVGTRPRPMSRKIVTRQGPPFQRRVAESSLCSGLRK